MLTRTLPPQLYKYRSFDSNSLRLVSEAELFYASPKSFNDPLDCDPTVQGDIDRASMEDLFSHMVAATYANNGSEKAKRAILELRYSSKWCEDNEDTDTRAENRYKQLLIRGIERLLDAEMNSWGVLCLAEDWNCPLMWSHYADKHRGLCIEYDMHKSSCPGIKPVDYRCPRGIKITELIEWKLHNSSQAKKNVLDTYFFTKSPSWGYEKEWRDICETSGIKSAPFRISGVYFGLRCDAAVRKSIVMLCANANWLITCYDLYQLEDGSLDRQSVNPDEVKACGVRSPAFLDFENISLDESKDA